MTSPGFNASLANPEAQMPLNSGALQPKQTPLGEGSVEGVVMHQNPEAQMPLNSGALQPKQTPLGEGSVEGVVDIVRKRYNTVNNKIVIEKI